MSDFHSSVSQESVRLCWLQETSIVLSWQVATETHDFLTSVFLIEQLIEKGFILF